MKAITTLSLNILVIEDDPIASLNLTKTLESSHGHRVMTAQSSKVAKNLIAKNNFDMAFVDLDLEEKKAGFKLIPILKKSNVFSVILSGHGSGQYIEKGYNTQCDDYLTKPYGDEQLEYVFNKYYSKEKRDKFRGLIKEQFPTENDFILRQLKIAERNVGSNKAILLSGPNGIGKNTIATAIHSAKHNNKDKFIHLNCSAIAKEYIEAEIFGSIKGLFGRGKAIKGKLLEAYDGTLFLENIDSMSITIQDKLLDAIETGSFIPVGGNHNDKGVVDCKLILSTCSKQENLRENLCYRFRAEEVRLTSLKERLEDRKLLIQAQIRKLNTVRAFIFNKTAVNTLTEYNWYGNLKEMDNYFKSLCSLDTPYVTYNTLPDYIKKNINKMAPQKNCYITDDYIKMIEEVSYPVFKKRQETEIVKYFFKKFDFNKSKTGQILGMTPYTLKKYLEKIGEESDEQQTAC